MKKKTKNNQLSVKKIYSYAVSGLYSVDADVMAKEFDRIRDKYGIFNPELVVQESVSPDSVLHNEFKWDDAEAGKLYRREQAARMIRNIRVQIIDSTVEYNVRAYVNVRENKDESRSYIPIEKAIVNNTAYNDLLQQSKDEMESFVTKYSQISELNAVKLEMLKAISAIQTK